MIEEVGNNLPKVKVANQAAIKRMIYLNGPLSRIEIAKRLDLTLPTITTNICSMIANGVLEEVGGLQSTVKLKGRKTNMIDVIPGSRHFIGVEIKKEIRTLCVTDYRGAIIFKTTDDDYLAKIEDVLSSISKLIKSTLNKKEIKELSIDGIGISCPGLVNTDKGILQLHPQYKWKDIDIARIIRENTGYSGPITVDNDASSRAVAASLFDSERCNHCRSFAFLYVSDGISCNFQIRNANFTTSSVGPGEIGYMVMDTNLPADQFGSKGRLSEFAGTRRLKEKALECIKEGNAPYLKTILEKKGEIQMFDLLDAQNNGDQEISAILKQGASFLGFAIANIDNFVRPDLIFAEAQIFANEQNRDVFYNTLKNNTFRQSGDTPSVCFNDYDRFNGAKGAAAIAIQKELGTYIG